jgi:hypothetical protein
LYLHFYLVVGECCLLTAAEPLDEAWVYGCLESDSGVKQLELAPPQYYSSIDIHPTVAVIAVQAFVVVLKSQVDFVQDTFS